MTTDNRRPLPAKPIAVPQQKPVDWPVNWGRVLKWHRGPNHAARRAAAGAEARRRFNHSKACALSERINQWRTKQDQRLARRA